ncbi:MAG: hypothetical protein AAB467_05125 [Patescibacteria group bacterium]
MKSKILLFAVISVLVAGNIFFGLQYISALKTLDATKFAASTQVYNEKNILFLKLFVKSVIKSDTEVNFETRLKLENAVRELNDPQILAVWQSFVDSKTEADAQQNVKNLLDILVDKVYIR